MFQSYVPPRVFVELFQTILGSPMGFLPASTTSIFRAVFCSNSRWDITVPERPPPTTMKSQSMSAIWCNVDKRSIGVREEAKDSDYKSSLQTFSTMRPRGME